MVQKRTGNTSNATMVGWLRNATLLALSASASCSKLARQDIDLPFRVRKSYADLITKPDHPMRRVLAFSQITVNMLLP